MNYHYQIILIVSIITSLTLISCHSETDGRTDLRIGNKKYLKELYTEAENHYLKSQEKEKSIEALYGTGNAIQCQRQTYQTDQMEKMDSLTTTFYQKGIDAKSNNQLKRSKLYHNLGNLKFEEGLKNKKIQKIDMSNQKFTEAAENYKSSLRINPNDDETRYNLAMALYMIEKNNLEEKKQQQNEEERDKDKNKGKDENDKNNQNKDNQQDKKNNQNDNNTDKQKNDKDNTPQKQNKNNDEDRAATIDEKTANKLLNAAQRDENEVQKKIEKSIVNGTMNEKDW